MTRLVVVNLIELKAMLDFFFCLISFIANTHILKLGLNTDKHESYKGF